MEDMELYVASVLVGYYEDVKVEHLGVFSTYEAAEEAQNRFMEGRSDCYANDIFMCYLDCSTY